MRKTMTCTECPRGCSLVVEYDHNTVTSVTGNACPKGEHYAVAEIEHPMRQVTTSVVARGLELKMIPVRTDVPVPKEMIGRVLEAARAVVWTTPVMVGDCIVAHVAGLEANLRATRAAGQAMTNETHS